MRESHGEERVHDCLAPFSERAREQAVGRFLELNLDSGLEYEVLIGFAGWKREEREREEAHWQDVAVVGMKPLLLRVARFVQLYNLDVVTPGQQICNLLHRIVLVWQHGCFYSPEACRRSSELGMDAELVDSGREMRAGRLSRKVKKSSRRYDERKERPKLGERNKRVKCEACARFGVNGAEGKLSVAGVRLRAWQVNQKWQKVKVPAAA